MKKLKNNIHKIVGILLNILLVIISVLIVIGVFYITQIKLFNNDYANLLGYTFFEVATGSMSPTINVGDVVIVKITKEVNENDIIVFKEENNFITHRLIQKEEGKIITKGDANNSEDKSITEDSILGKVITIIPQIGNWRKAILSPEVISLILILIVLLIISFIYSARVEGKDE